MNIPSPSLRGIVGGSGVPKRRWVTTGGMTSVVAVPAAAAAGALPPVCISAPLPLGGISVLS